MSDCAPLNAKLAHVDPGHPGYRLRRIDETQPPDPRDRIFVVVTLSGGGTRAAAFGYGALEALRDLTVPVDGRAVSLLSELDVISSVSGGSFAAAYYAAFGPEKFFSDFPKDVLHRHIETALAFKVLAPWNWPLLWSPYFSRSDLAADYYERRIFGGKTFSELPERPLIVLNATDLTAGAPFPFLQDSFDALCSNLDPFPVGSAVASSSAFPVGFPPLTLRNWNATDDCGYEPSKAIVNAIKGGPEANAHDYERATERFSFTTPERRYLHLSDGGISDNLGVRAVLAGLVSGVPDLPILQRVNGGRIDKLVVITVDAKPGVAIKKDHGRRAPTFLTVLSRAASAPMANYSTDSVAWLQESIDTDAAFVLDAIAAGGVTLPHCFDYYGVHVQFENAPPEIKERLKHIGTRLELPKKDVALLIDEGRRQVGQSKELARLLRDLKDPETFPCPSPPDE